MDPALVAYQWIVWTLGLLALAFVAQRERSKSEALAEALLEAHDWVDEIIDALQADEGSEAEERLDRLVAEQRPDGWSGCDQCQPVRD